VLDMFNRGAVAGLIGAPADLINMAISTRWPELAHVPGGSEDWGKTMEKYGLVSDKRRPAGEIAAGFVSPESWGAPLAKGAAALASSPMIFSRLERGLMQAPVKAIGTGTSAEQWLTSNLGKYQMSKLESELAGLTDYLQKAGKGPVTREEMLDVVRKGQPKVEEVWYGKPELFPPDSYMDPDTGDIGTWEDWAAETEDFSEYGGLSQAEQLERLLDVSGEPIAVLDKNPKYSDYTLPGGENYRELLLTLPPTNRSDVFKSNHWPENDVVAHVRMNDRVSPDGKKTLFIEEIQSDWGQAGRDKGFKGSAPPITDADRQAAKEYFDVKPDFWETAAKEDKDAYVLEMRERLDTKKVPTAPYVTDTKAWTQKSVDHIMHYAAENGYDNVAFINGMQSADRYDLSKQIGEIHYSGTNLKAYDHSGNTVINQTGITQNELPDYVGKEAAEKLLAQEPQGTLRSLTGVDLQFGGKGMNAYYDKIVPSVVSKRVKQYGGRVGTTDIGEGVGQFSFEITPEMRSKVLNEGFPSFKKGGPVKGYAKGDLVSMYDDYHDTSFKDRARATLNDKHK
jgi:hypothetical protein